MDDPWGSPWAINDDSNPSSTSLTLEPPPRALLSTKPLSASNDSLSVSSPWANIDDASGDWASADSATTPNTALNPWASWGDTSQQPSPRRGTPRKDSLVAWPTNTSAASSPSLRPVPQSHIPTGSKPALSRQPSFDPWKSDISLTISAEEPFGPGIQIDSSRLSRSSRPSLKDLKIRQPSKSDGLEEAEYGSLTTPKARPDLVVSDACAKEYTRNPENDHHHHSRPSSRSSRSSTREDFTARDSPITSVDEEVREPSNNMRKTSTKVQELVEMFDDLTNNTDVANPLTTKKPGEIIDSGPQGVEEEEDFGDFEDATDGDDSDENEAEMHSSMVQSPTIEKTGVAHEDGAHSGLSVRKRAQSIKVEIEIRLDAVDQLFPPLDETVQAAKGHKRRESFTHILYDTFAGDSERRTWYRISRFGSMLRNGAPDFENYTSVSWPKTNVHDDTLKTVRRWIQGETLGSSGTDGNGTSSGFGWDSAAPTVSMEEIFGRKRGSHISTTLGKSQAQPLSMAPFKSPISSTISSASPNTPTFGWSTSPVEPAAPPMRTIPLPREQPRGVLHQKQMSNPWTGSVVSPTTLTNTGSGRGPQVGLEDKPAQSPVAAQSLEYSQTGHPYVDEQKHATPHEASPASVKSSGMSVASNNGFDDDDEWGEMICPVAADVLPLTPTMASKPTVHSPVQDEEILQIISRLPDLSWMLK